MGHRVEDSSGSFGGHAGSLGAGHQCFLCFTYGCKNNHPVSFFKNTHNQLHILYAVLKTLSSSLLYQLLSMVTSTAH